MRIVILFGLAVLLCACASTPVAVVRLTDSHQFNPVEPELSPSISVVTKATGETELRTWSTLTNAEVRKLLPNQIASITTYKRSAGGGLSYVAASTTVDRGAYKVVMDYLNYVVEDRVVNNKVVGRQRVGVGVRIQADIQTEKADVNLGGIFSLGVAAQKKLISGSLRVTTLGVSYSGMPSVGFTKTLDESGIQDTLQYVAQIKAKMVDDTTVLSPYVVAVKSAEPPAVLGVEMVK